MSYTVIILTFVAGMILGMYLTRIEAILRAIASTLKQIKQNTNRDKGIVQTLKPINQKQETEHIVHSYSPKQVAAEVQRKFEERNTL